MSEEVEKKIKSNVKKLRSAFDAMREGFGIPPRIKWRDRISNFQHQRLQPQQNSPIPAPRIRERFPHPFLGFLQSQLEEPKGNPAEQMAMAEAKKQLLEQAKAREETERLDRERAEKQENLRKAKLRMAVFI